MPQIVTKNRTGEIGLLSTRL